MSWIELTPDETSDPRADELRVRLHALSDHLLEVRRRSRQYARRWWAAVLQPFVLELTEDRAVPFLDALVGLGLHPDLPAGTSDHRLEELAHSFGLPYPRAWPGMLRPVVMPALATPALLPSDSAILAHWFNTGMQHEMLMGAAISAGEVGLGGSQLLRAIRLTPPPAFVSSRERYEIVSAQLKQTFGTVWKTSRRRGRKMRIILLRHDGSFTEFYFPDRGLFVDLPAPFERRTAGSLRLEFVRLLVDRYLPPPEKHPAYPTTGALPERRDVARWWAMRAFEKLTIAEIASRDDPHSEDPALEERIGQALYRLRRTVTEAPPR